MRLLASLLLLLAIAHPAAGREPGVRRVGKNSAGGMILRKRTNINPLIAEGGSAEVDGASLFSLRNRAWTLPTVLRITPREAGWWSRTELGLAFDALASVANGGRRVTHFGETLTLTATHVLVQSERFDVAVAPQATLFLREDSGARLGGLAIGRYDHGAHAISGTLNWTAATRAGDGNPGQLADFGLGYGWRRGRWSPHGNLVWEVATGTRPALSVFEGVEYQINGRLSLDVSLQHIAVRGGIADHQLLVGLNWGGFRLR